jgi:hypothetical protein
MMLALHSPRLGFEHPADISQPGFVFPAMRASSSFTSPR